MYQYKYTTYSCEYDYMYTMVYKVVKVYSIWLLSKITKRCVNQLKLYFSGCEYEAMSTSTQCCMYQYRCTYFVSTWKYNYMMLYVSVHLYLFFLWVHVVSHESENIYFQQSILKFLDWPAWLQNYTEYWLVSIHLMC